jgi:TetR/AcrR family transcriptional regulator, cholesterol catabolism regulator
VVTQEKDKVSSKSERTRQRVLHAAAQAFRQNGYTSSSLRDIAENAGMQAGSLYYHFDSKEDLAEAVMDEGVLGAEQAARQAVAELGDHASPIDRIEAAFRGHLGYLLREADFAVATLRMLHQTPDGIRMRHLRKQRAFGRFYGELFEAARRAGLIRPEFDLGSLRMLLLGALNWSPEWFDPSGLSPDALVAQLSAMMRHGVMPEKVTTIGETGTRGESHAGNRY